MELIIRRAGGADLPALARLTVAERAGDPEEWQARFAADAADPDVCFLIAAEADRVAEEADGVWTEAGRVLAYGRASWFEPGAGAPAGTAPAGYYLTGLMVAPGYRRRGIGERLTRARMSWAAERADEIWFFANARNGASLRLHAGLGFEEVTRIFEFPGVSFDGGVGVLGRAALSPGRRSQQSQPYQPWLAGSSFRRIGRKRCP